MMQLSGDSCERIRNVRLWQRWAWLAVFARAKLTNFAIAATNHVHDATMVMLARTGMTYKASLE